MIKQDMELKILKVTDGKAGHITITDGVIEAIQKNYQVQIIELKVTLRAKFFLPILKFIFNDDWLSAKIRDMDWLIPFFYKSYERPNQQIDLIISSGGDTSFINIWLAAGILDVKNIYCSGLRGIKPEYFSLFISTLELDLKNSIKLEVAPEKVGSHTLSNDVTKFCKDKRIDKKEKYFISTKVSGATEVLNEKFLFDGFNMALKINDIYENYVIYQKEYGQLAKEIQDRFLLENISQEHMRYYQSIIDLEQSR